MNRFFNPDGAPQAESRQVRAIAWRRLQAALQREETVVTHLVTAAIEAGQRAGQRYASIDGLWERIRQRATVVELRRAIALLTDSFSDFLPLVNAWHNRLERRARARLAGALLSP